MSYFYVCVRAHTALTVLIDLLVIATLNASIVLSVISSEALCRLSKEEQETKSAGVRIMRVDDGVCQTRSAEHRVWQC